MGRWAIIIVALAQAAFPAAPSNLQVFTSSNNPELDKTAPTVTITTPTISSTFDNGTTAAVTLGGTSTDATGIASCSYVNSLGGSGNASTAGNGNWSVSVSLAVGSNAITVTCKDPGNNAGTDIITVTRSSSGGGSLTCDTSTSVTTSANLQSYLTGLGNPDGTQADPYVICINANISFTSNVSYTTGDWNVFKGAGSQSTLGGGSGNTVFTDNITSSGNTAILSISHTGAGLFRMTGITIQGGSGVVKDGSAGVFNIGGSSSGGSMIRLDHMTFDQHTYSSPGSQHLPVFNNVQGVVDNSILRSYANGAIFLYHGRASADGDEVWAEDSGFGSVNSFVVFEDLEVYGSIVNSGSIPSRFWDCSEGGKGVLRFSTMSWSAGGEVHATGHSGNGRSCRAYETYGNYYITTSGPGLTGRNVRSMVDMQGGTGLTWGNTADANTIINYATFSNVRRNTATYNLSSNSPPPNSFGHCGPGPTPSTGTVTVSGVNVTRVSGTSFSTSWPADTMIHIAGATCVAVAGQVPGANPSCGIASVTNGNAIVLTNGGSSTTISTPATYTTGSAWDGNTDVYGYPCLDQPGRGKGQLLSGDFPTKTNTSTGTIAWPNQLSEPHRFWMLSGTPITSAYSNGAANIIVADRDYYAQASGVQTTSSSPFNGTTGGGWGTIARRPSTCTTGVHYWATDEGSWNTSSTNPEGVQFSGADGKLYICTATNTWTARYGDPSNTSGEPLAYPHPYRSF